MPAQLPHRALRALAEAFPYRAESAFSAARVELGGNVDALDAPTHALADAYEREAARIARGHSLLTIEELRDHAWFGGPRRNVALHEHLARLAAYYLRPQGDRIVLQDDENLELAQQWRMLSLYLPSDLVIAALGEHPPSSRVDLSTPRLRALLSRPVCETHMHLGAALPFDLLWLALQHGLASPHFVLESLPARGVPFDAPALWMRRLLAAALARHLILAFLWHRGIRGDEVGGFETFIAARLSSIARFSGRAELVERACRIALWELCAPDSSNAPVNVAELRLAHRLLWGESHRVRPSSVGTLLASDPVSTWLSPVRDTRPEIRLLARCIGYLKKHADTAFARVFWQYVRIRSLAHAHVVETPGTAGLDWFTRHYERIAWYRQRVDDGMVDIALDLASSGVRLHALELRIAPPDRWANVRDTLRGVARGVLEYELPAAAQRPEIGVLFHFIKQARDAGGRLHAAPDSSTFGCRHGRWIADAERRARAIAAALRHCPELALVLRGIDVASTELAQPTWALLLPFARVRHAFEEATARLARLYPRWRVDCGRVTMHLGEEFRRITEGLRRVHEAISCGLLLRGDRIGHGLVLGIDVETWSEQASAVLQPREDRLDDLLWEIDLVRNRRLPCTMSRLARIEAEAGGHGQAIYGPDVTIDQLSKARALRHDLGVLRDHQLPWIRGDRAHRWEGPSRLLAMYWLDARVFERGSMLVQIPSDHEDVHATKTMQMWVKQLVAKLELTIESNPSSNMVIGDFLQLRDIPMFRLASWDISGSTDSALHVSVNTDDPLSFATRLADEYAHVHHAMINAGATSTQALEWLERARTSGVDSRFTAPESARVECLRALI